MFGSSKTSSLRVVDDQQESKSANTNITNLEGVKEKDLEDYKQILNILLGAGYFRVRIASLTPFDKILGGLCWCISNSYNADADVEMLSYEEEANIGKKIKLAEKVVLALRRMGCSTELNPVQIQGLDCPFILQVFSWLVKKVHESREENKERIQRFSELQFSRKFELPQDTQSMQQYTQAVPYLESIKGFYHPKRKFKHQQRKQIKNEWGHVQTVLLEYGVEFKKIERSQQEKEDKSKLERQLRAQKTKTNEPSSNLVEDLDEETKEKKIQELKKLVEQNENFYNNISASGASTLISLGAQDIMKLKEEYDGKTKDFMDQQENLQTDQTLHKRNVAQLTKKIENQKVIYLKAKEEYNNVKIEYDKIAENYSKFKEYNEQILDKINQLKNTVETRDVDQTVIKKLETLIATNESYKKQESEFKTECQQKLKELKESIATLEQVVSDPNDPIVQLQQSYVNDMEKMKKIKKLAAKRNRELAIIQSKIDEIPSRTELSQYERRFTELFTQISSKLDETKKYFVSYNTLSSTCSFMEQELSLLNAIADFFQKSVQSQDKKYRTWMVTTISDRVEKVRQTKEQVNQKLKETEKKRDDLQTKYNELVSKQRNYFRAVKEFQHEMLKNEELNKSLGIFGAKTTTIPPKILLNTKKVSSTAVTSPRSNSPSNNTTDHQEDELTKDIKEHQLQTQSSKVEIKRQVSDIESEKEKKNWLIHVLYTRQDIDECLNTIEEQIRACEGKCEYAIYVKGLIKRQQGDITQSLQLFQQACILNPMNPQNIKQVGKSLFLMGKFKEAIEIYDEAKRISPQDWEIWHNKGLCHANLGDFEKAEECYQRSNSIQRHDITFIELGKIFTIQERYEEAIDIYLEALDFSPENPELLSTVGLLYLRVGDNLKAFDYLGNSLSHDPTNPKTILATGSIIQDHGEMEVALSKYRIAAKKNPNSAQLWNNIGMCFFGKQDYVTSIACLKRALYLAPFEWIISYNLGLVHLNTRQYASAFHYFSTSINLNPNFASTYMYLGITLNRLDDFENACSAYEKAIEMEGDYLFELNYAITLYNHQNFEQSKAHFVEFERLFHEAHTGEDAEECDDEFIMEARKKLSTLLSS